MYIAITLAIFIAFSFWEGTTDGLWFWCVLACLVADRWQTIGKRGGRFIRGMKKGQSIWNYGIYNAVVSFIQNPNTPVSMRLFDIIRRWAGICFFVIFVLHVYIATIIVVKYVFPEQINAYLHMTTEPFLPLLNKWYSARKTLQTLTDMGYGHRTLIVAHVYLAVVIAWLLSMAYLFWYSIHAGRMGQYYDRLKMRAQETAKLESWQVTLVVKIFILTATCIGMMFFCWFVLQMFVFLPEEIATDYHKRRIWFMLSHVYQSDMGLFFPAYYVYTFLMVFYFTSMPAFVSLTVPARRFVKSKFSGNKSVDC